MSASVPESSPVSAIVIGASAGAIQALLRILPQLPSGFALPVLVVIHVPPGRRSELAGLFAGKCRVPVREAEDKEPIVPGTVYFAPPDYHLLVEVAEGADHTLSLSTDEPVFFSRPSIDVLFESAAEAYGDALMAVVLTGANEDGARGLRSVAEAGGRVCVQDPATAYARTMPDAALAACRRARVLSIPQIVDCLIDEGRKAA
ncbi:chemotaxis protein CheB [Novosphingobium gossypii]|uniref:chemotaxis protein CheB n=1 Tax=Novosphingobium gossypii TaxID=1604774 RepID=UPI003D1BD03E